MKRVCLILILSILIPLQAHAIKYKGDLESNESVTLPEQGSTPANPPAGKQKVYVKTDGLHVLDSAGVDQLLNPFTTADEVKVDEIKHSHYWLRGIDFNYAAAVDAAALDIIGDLDLMAEVSFDDWTPGFGTRYLISKYVSGGDQRSFRFGVSSTGFFSLAWSPDGTSGNLITKSSSVANTFVDGTKHWIRVTLDVDNGASGNDVKFYTSDDAISWTQLGSTQTTAGVTSIHSGTAEVQLTGGGEGVGVLAGKYYRAQMLNGIGGTIVLDAEFHKEITGTTSFTESSAQAATVTLNTSGGTPGQIVGLDKRLYNVEFIEPIGTVDGRDLAVDGTKLDEIETAATADQTGAEIKTAYEVEANAFTDAQFTKLSAIDSLADVTDASSVDAAGAVMDSDISEAEGFLRKTGAGAYEGIKSNLNASVDPTANEDSGDGYAVGSIWINTTLDKILQAVDVTVAAAVWKDLSSGSATAWTTLSDTPGSITADQVVVGNSGGTALEFAVPGDVWTNTGSIDLTSGSPTSVSLVSSLTDVHEIEIHIDGWSTNTANQGMRIQIGDSGGLETSGYTGWTEAVTSASFRTAFGGSDFEIGDNPSFDAANFTDVVISLKHMGSNVWSFKVWGSSDQTAIFLGGTGLKTLTGALDRVSLITDGGSATFDGGTAYVRTR